MLEPPLRDALALVARRPGMLVVHMAHDLGQDPRGLALRIALAVRQGWLSEHRGCCGRVRFEITPAGRAVLCD